MNIRIESCSSNLKYIKPAQKQVLFLNYNSLFTTFVSYNDIKIIK